MLAAELLVDCDGHRLMLDFCQALAPGRNRTNENPRLGLILYPQEDESVTRGALEGLPNRIMSAECPLSLRDIAPLAARIDRTRQVVELRVSARSSAPNVHVDQGFDGPGVCYLRRRTRGR